MIWTYRLPFNGFAISAAAVISCRSVVALKVVEMLVQNGIVMPIYILVDVFSTTVANFDVIFVEDLIKCWGMIKVLVD